ncbi:rpo operon protein, partial [Candidatus Halobonum tyrrellensis G22]
MTLPLRLPDDLRSAFKEPLGPVYTDAEALLAEAGDP